MTSIKISKNSIVFAFFSLIILMPAYITDQMSFFKALYIFSNAVDLNLLSSEVHVR